MATGSQSDDFNVQTVDKKKSKYFSHPKFLKKSKTHPDEKRSTDISSSAPLPFNTPQSPPVDTPKPLPIDDQTWANISNKQRSPSNVSPTKVHPSTEKLQTEKLEPEEIDLLKKRVEHLSLELIETKKELQYTKEIMEKERKDASNALQQARNEVQNAKEYWSKCQSSKEIELKEKYLNSQEELSKKERIATVSKLAIEKQFIRVQAQYEEQQKRVQQVEKELATAHEEMRFKDRTIGELNGRIKEKNETSNQLKGDTVTLKEKDDPCST